MTHRLASQDHTHSSTSTYACPVDVTLGVIRGKWKPLILWLLSDGALRFSELEAAIPQIAHKVLSQQLRQLERDGVIHRRLQATAVSYEFTEFGHSLRPVLDALADWGKRHQHALPRR